MMSPLTKLRLVCCWLSRRTNCLRREHRLNRYILVNNVGTDPCRRADREVSDMEFTRYVPWMAATSHLYVPIHFARLTQCQFVALDITVDRAFNLNRSRRRNIPVIVISLLTIDGSPEGTSLPRSVFENILSSPQEVCGDPAADRRPKFHSANATMCCDRTPDQANFSRNSSFWPRFTKMRDIWA